MYEYNFYIAAINRGDANPSKYFQQGNLDDVSFYSFDELMQELKS